MASKLQKPRTAVDKVGGIVCHFCNRTLSNKRVYDKHYFEHKPESPDITYTCPECRKSFTGYSTFRGHCYNVHVSKEKYKCDKCDKSFPRISTLKDHVKTMHTFRCLQCDNHEFSSKKELLQHQLTHMNSKRTYACKTCGKTIEDCESSKTHADEHVIYHYRCPICDKKLPNKEQTTEHLLEHFGEDDTTSKNTEKSEITDTPILTLGGILCYICNASHKNKTELDHHFSSNHVDCPVKYSCKICPKQYEKYSLFSKHCYDHQNRGKFRCEYCDKVFHRLSRLVVHSEKCSQGKSFKVFECDHCGHEFATENRLRAHVRNLHDRGTFRCNYDDCGLEFPSPKELILHQRTHNSSNNWCRLCGLKFTSLTSCENHLAIHMKTSFPCPICGRAFDEKRSLTNHLALHFKNELHACETCAKLFPTHQKLFEHMKTHSQIKALVCQTCGKGFSKPSALQEHINSHTGAKPYKCEACPKAFNNLPNWMKHVQKIHKIDPKSLGASKSKAVDKVGGMVCHVCSARFSSRATFERHYVGHGEGQALQYTCPRCGKRVIGYAAYSIHCYTSHFARDNYRCDKCNKSFTKSLYLREHLVTAHTFRCQQCKQELSSKQELLQHQLIHMSDKPLYECKICGKILDNRTNLRDHTKIHEEQQFCPLCGKRCRSSRMLQAHFKSHLDSRPYKCIACPKAFTQQVHWSKHLREIHNIDPDMSKTDMKQNNNEDGYMFFNIEESVESICSELKKENNLFDIDDPGDLDSIDPTFTEDQLKLYTCKICQKEFSSEFILKLHLKNHIMYKPYKCVACPKTFIRYTTVARHLRDVHNYDLKVIKTIDLRNDANPETEIDSFTLYFPEMECTPEPIDESKAMPTPLIGQTISLLSQDEFSVDPQLADLTFPTPVDMSTTAVELNTTPVNLTITQMDVTESERNRIEFQNGYNSNILTIW